ncbi:hypothetical protein Q1695_001038 [Nippostrongylus brasiliensis]|nr:hypothetical protein Q1695_001038 [Nippostrongylus brasiliensis]
MSKRHDWNMLRPTPKLWCKSIEAVANIELRLIRLERTLNGIDKNMPAVQGDLEFRYTTAENARADELGHRLDERHSRERVTFIRECLYEFYVPAVLRDEMWRGVKTALNTRARMVCENQNDRAPQ